MDKWESLVDKLIRESMERGEFEGLAGEGEPIDLSENPFEAPELRTAHRLLRNAGFAPAWIEERKDIETSFAQAKAVLIRAKELYLGENRLLAQWQRAAQEFRETVAELNQRVRVYNLKTPAAGFQRKVFDAEALISELEATK